MTRALNKTFDEDSDPIIDEYVKKFGLICGKDACLENLNTLLHFIEEDQGCDVITAAANLNMKVGNLYPCWRDNMIIKAGTIFQSVL